jgi:hypothetical protein
VCLSENEYYELNGDLMSHLNAFHVFDCIVTVLKIFLVLHTVRILDTDATFIQDIFVSCNEDCVRNTQKCIYSMKWPS